MCSIYSLDIFPLYNGSEIKTKTTKFRTKSQVQNPKNVKLTLDRVKDKVNIQWDSVKCANNYKIFQELSSPTSPHSSKGSEWTYLTNKVKARLNSPEPCSLVRWEMKVCQFLLISKVFFAALVSVRYFRIKKVWPQNGFNCRFLRNSAALISQYWPSGTISTCPPQPSSSRAAADFLTAR